MLNGQMHTAAPLPLSARDTVRFTPEGGAERTYRLIVPTVALKARYMRELQSLCGYLYSDADAQRALREAVHEMFADLEERAEVQAFLDEYEVAAKEPAIEPLPEDVPEEVKAERERLLAERAARDEKMQQLRLMAYREYQPFRAILACQIEARTIGNMLALKLFVRSFEGLARASERRDGMLTDRSFEAIPEEDQGPLIAAVSALMTPAEAQKKS